MTPFGKHSEMTVHEKEPLNAETPLVHPPQSLLTPRQLFFSRNHGSMLEVDPDSFGLSVGGMVDREPELSMEDLRTFPSEKLVAVIECAGNRRAGLTEVTQIPGETPWGAGAIGNARWAGVPLRERPSSLAPASNASCAGRWTLPLRRNRPRRKRCGPSRATPTTPGTPSG